MGAAVKTEGKVAVAEGVEILYGASVEAPDLRGGAALVVAYFVQRAKPKSAAWSISKEATSVLSLLLHQSGQISRKFRVIRFLTVAGRVSASADSINEGRICFERR